MGVSWGIGCAYMPGVFSRVSEAYDWISEEVCEHGANLKATSFQCPGSPPASAPNPAPKPKPAPAPQRFPSSNQYWRKVAEENFLSNLGDFTDGGGDSKRMNKKNGRNGVVKLQRGKRNKKAASIFVKNIDVSAYSKCHVAVSFYLIGMGNDESWQVEYAAGGSDRYKVSDSFGPKNYRKGKWYDDIKANDFSVKNMSRVSLRLRCNGNSARDAVFISGVTLECH